MNSVATQPPSQGHIHDASRRVRISSQPDIREAACVCARWAGPGPTWAQADRDLTTNVASRGCSAWSNPNRHLQMAVEGNQEVETFATKDAAQSLAHRVRLWGPPASGEPVHPEL